MSFAQTLVSVAGTPLKYENSELLDAALEVLPLGELYEKAEAREEADPQWGLQDYLIMECLAWFKNDFFKWVNSPECPHCGGETRIKGGVQPNPEERRDDAGVVELYGCTKCGREVRFPRYNSTRKLLEFRKGRCGEWANCFTMICRALGSTVRYIWNSEDHVWTEVYSDRQQRWVHADSCENAWDKPLLYGEGWGKKMAYVIGFSTDGAVDVTRRYVRDADRALPRDKISDAQLSTVLFQLTSARRVNLSPTEIMRLDDRDSIEQAELASYEVQPKPTAVETLGPRESGAGDWTRQRGEDGAN